MKNILPIMSVIAVGLALAVGLASLVFGWEPTSRSITLITARFGSMLSGSPERILSGSKIVSAETSLLEGFEQQYSNINLSDVDVLEFEKRPAPFYVPTDGIAAHQNFLYDPVNHGGIDIWTRLDGKGVDGSSSKGYPVFSACSGMVIRVYQPNEEIEILCDKIDSDYKDTVPSLTVKALYAHMGNAVTKERHHLLRVGQRVKRGELIGYQGNVSSIVPVNRVVHLHFGIYDLTRPGRPTVNPEAYIGVRTTKVGQRFSTVQN